MPDDYIKRSDVFAMLNEWHRLNGDFGSPNFTGAWFELGDKINEIPAGDVYPVQNQGERVLNDAQLCPFCGGKPKLISVWAPIYQYQPRRWAVVCSVCDVVTPSYLSDHDAVEHWDKRVK